jgi:uncharacterized membrane protein YgdD (TMEM256/DUF423 family)
MSARTALTLASLLMFLAVGAGAFGAHALRARMAPDMLANWQTAVQYQVWHALGLAVVGLLLIHAPDRAGLALAGWLFVAGIVLFSGSLYTLALTGTTVHLLPPLGGAAFLAGWLALAWAAAR